MKKGQPDIFILAKKLHPFVLVLVIIFISKQASFS
jgi:hypothetical protein